MIAETIINNHELKERKPMSREQKGTWVRWAALILTLVGMGAAVIKRDEAQQGAIIGAIATTADHEQRLRDLERTHSEIAAMRRTIDRIENKLDKLP